MSIYLKSGAARTLYDDMAKEAYQSAGPDARKFTTYRTTGGADTFVFRTMGRTTAKNRVVTQSELENANISHAKVSVSMNNVYASDVTDVFDQDTTNSPQEITDLARTLSFAVKRKETQYVIDALSGAGSYAATIAHGSAGLTIAKIIAGLKALRANDIMEPPTLFYTENQEADVLALSQFTSADYARIAGGNPNAMAGEVQNGHYGIANYVRIGSGRSETGLPISSTTRDCFLFVPSAVGLVVGFDGGVKTEVVRNEHLMWRHTVYTRVAATAIDTAGIVKVQCTES